MDRQSSRRIAILGVLCALGGWMWHSGSRVGAQGGPAAATIRIGVQRGGGYEIVTLPVETYIGRVLAGEALPGSAPAALEALAIAIRTYSTANRGRHRAEGFDLCDQTHCQVMRTATPATDRAAVATAGRILLYRGVPASVFYSASCGGRTEKPSNVWPGADDPPYLPSRSDDGCGGSPEWTTELTLSDLRRAFAAAGYRGTLRSIRIAGHNESGRVSRLMLDGLTPSDISGQDLRVVVGRTLGWQRIQSAAFELRRAGTAYRFQGHGAGHGVGMCVIGSSKLATAGESAEEILGRYFPGTVIAAPGTRPKTTELPRIGAPPEVVRTIPPPTDLPRPDAVQTEPPRSGVEAPRPDPPQAPAPAAPPAATSGIVLSLPDADRADRTEITGLIQRGRDEIAKGLGITVPARVSVRFHPTAEAYERATRQPWFMLGATINSEVQMPPLAVLRSRGLLDRSLRHQLVHVMTDTTLAGRAAWVQEGAAVHFAQSGTGPATRAACPSDDELLRPVSAGALGDAYARARACVERQLTAGKTWQEVR